MSDTPTMDAAFVEAQDLPKSTLVVRLEDARLLERELAEAREENKDLSQLAAHFKGQCDVLHPMAGQITALERELAGARQERDQWREAAKQMHACFYLQLGDPDDALDQFRELEKKEANK